MWPMANTFDVRFYSRFFCTLSHPICRRFSHFFRMAAFAVLLGAAGVVHAVSPASLPTTRPAARAVPAPTARLRPYTAFAWSTVGPMRHVSPFIWVTGNSNPGILAQQSRRMPDGCRVLFSWNLTDGLLEHPADVSPGAGNPAEPQPDIWATRGAEVVEQRVSGFFGQFADAGGQCDAAILDFEGGWSNWVMTTPRLAAVQRDPRFQPIAAQLGFPDPAERLIWQRAVASGDYLTWNALMGGRLNDVLNRAVAQPVARHFPGAWLSNFQSVVMPRDAVIPDANGVLQHTAGESYGNCQSPVVYGTVLDIAVRMPGPDWKSPMTAVIWGTNHVRSAARSSPMPILPWVAFRSWPGDNRERQTVPWANTDYWQESIYHTMLSGGCNNVLFWNPRARVGAGSPPPHGTSGPADADAMNAAMAELERQAGNEPLVRPLTTAAADYAAGALVSAARTRSGRKVARITFREGVETASVEIEGRTYRAARPRGQVGTWVVLP